jgi:hypothetical protein
MLSNLCCSPQIANYVLQKRDIAIYDNVLSEFRGMSPTTVKSEALNTLVCLITNADIDAENTLFKMCKELISLIYEELTDIKDDSNLQVIILEVLSAIFSKFSELKIEFLKVYDIDVLDQYQFSHHAVVGQAYIEFMERE